MLSERLELPQGVLATRKPWLLNALTGVLPARCEERTASEVLKHAPPRTARVVPDAGPAGFVDGLDA